MKFSIKSLVLPLGFLALAFGSCKKADDVAPLGDKGQKTIRFIDYGGLGSNFSSNANLAFDPASTSEIMPLQLEYLTNAVSDKDITVTVAVDPAALTAYNAPITDPKKQYTLLPTADYTFPTTQVLIKAGNTVSEPFNIEFNPSVIDPSINYMLPLSITAISGVTGVTKAAGTGTAYFHFIGNPLAGNYTTNGTRTNYTTNVAWAGPPAAFPAGGTDGTTAAYNGTVFASAVDAQTIVLPMGNIPDATQTATGGLAQYFITANATYSSITFDNGAGFGSATNGYTNIVRYLISYTPPSTGVKPAFHFITKYTNAAGADRIVDQNYVHQ